MLIFRNTERVHGQRKVGNPCPIPSVDETGESVVIAELQQIVSKMAFSLKG